MNYLRVRPADPTTPSMKPTIWPVDQPTISFNQPLDVLPMADTASIKRREEAKSNF